MSDAENDRPGTSTWYFVGAVFIFAMPTLLFRDLEVWARAGIIVVAFIVIVAGIVQLRREMNARRRGGSTHDRT